MQRVSVKRGHKRTSRNGMWEVMDAHVYWLLQEPSTDHFRMVLEAKLTKPAERDGVQ